MGPQKILGPTKFWVCNKINGLKKIVRSEINLGPKKILGPKKLLVQKVFGPKKSLCPKTIGLKLILGPKKMFGPKEFSQKNVGFKNCRAKIF